MVEPRALPVRPIIGFVLASGAVAPDDRTRSTERVAARSSPAESGEHPDACPGAPKPHAHRYSGWLGRHRRRRNGTAVVDGDDAANADKRLLNPPNGPMTSLAISAIDRSSVGMRTTQSGDSCSSCSASRHVLSRCAASRRRR
jgi:hypothetical protein